MSRHLPGAERTPLTLPAQLPLGPPNCSAEQYPQIVRRSINAVQLGLLEPRWLAWLLSAAEPVQLAALTSLEIAALRGMTDPGIEAAFARAMADLAGARAAAGICDPMLAQ